MLGLVENMIGLVHSPVSFRCVCQHSKNLNEPCQSNLWYFFWIARTQECDRILQLFLTASFGGKKNGTKGTPQWANYVGDKRPTTVYRCES